MTRKVCKNDPMKTYKGNEPSPKGLGWCAHAESKNTIKSGKDGNKWIISLTKNGTKRWIKYNLSKQTQKKPYQKTQQVDHKISYKDMKLEVTFIPYTIKNDDAPKKLRNGKLYNYIVSKKLKRVKYIVDGILNYYFTVKKYKFNIKTKLFTFILKPKPSFYYFTDCKGKSTKRLPREFKSCTKSAMKEYFGNTKELLTSVAMDSWFGGEIDLSNPSDFDENTYYLGITCKNIKFL